MAKRGVRDVMLVPGPEPHGNAAAGRDRELAFPTGAHYLPLPSMESRHMREMLSEFGAGQLKLPPGTDTPPITQVQTEGIVGSERSVFLGGLSHGDCEGPWASWW